MPRIESVALLFSPFVRANLEEYINRPTNEQHLLALYQILDGLSALHHQGLVYCNIKPANIGI